MAQHDRSGTFRQPACGTASAAASITPDYCWTARRSIRRCSPPTGGSISPSMPCPSAARSRVSKRSGWGCRWSRCPARAVSRQIHAILGRMNTGDWSARGWSANSEDDYVAIAGGGAVYIATRSRLRTNLRAIDPALIHDASERCRYLFAQFKLVISPRICGHPG